jgi:hypothetical protein
MPEELVPVIRTKEKKRRGRARTLPRFERSRFDTEHLGINFGVFM